MLVVGFTTSSAALRLLLTILLLRLQLLLLEVQITRLTLNSGDV